ncbi:MAG: YSC84-related protein [Burkholderiales bacterium]
MLAGKRMKVAAAVASALMLVSGCTVNQGPPQPSDSTREGVEAGASSTMATLYQAVPGARDLERKAVATLVFPRILEAGLVVGGEHGRGVLHARGRPDSFYDISGLSVGWQAGAQSKAMVFMFLTPQALDKFLASHGWTAGADASVAVVNSGANATLDTLSAKSEVVAFALTNSGLMAAAKVDGTKITPVAM